MQLDTGNALNGGADVNAEILASAGRTQIIHLKPYSLANGYETIIGDLGDSIDYNTILPFCKEKGGTLVYVIEYECETLFTDLEGVRICIKNLKEKYGNLL
jgi:sugar phosphate isomerase/epimerase